MSSFDSIQALYVFLFYGLFIIVVLILWHFLWLKPFPLMLPTPEHIHMSNMAFEARISSLKEGVKYIFSIIFKRYDPSFWMLHCGFEAFCYMHFMRRMLLMTFAIFLITFGFGIPYSLAYSGSDIMNSFDLNDDIYKVFIQIFFLFLFAFIFYYTLYKIKTEISDSFSLFHLRNSELKMLESRTLHIRGFDKEIFIDGILNRIRELFDLDPTVQMNAILVPEISTLYKKEIIRKQLTIAIDILQDDPGFLTSCLFKKSKILAQLEALDKEIDYIKNRDFDSNGSIFFICDSDQFYSLVASEFSVVSCALIHPKKLYLELKEGLGFKPIPNPNDISWVNINKNPKDSWIKSALLNFLGIFVILFFTTPASLLQVVDLESLLETIISSADFLPGSFSSLLQKNLSPMLILLISNILLVLIDEIAYLHKNSVFSDTQQEIFLKCIIYLFFNNFLIPALSLTTIESIFSLLSQDIGVIDELFDTFYLNDTGSVFILLLMEAGIFSFTYYILRIGELFKGYLNRKVVMEKRRSKDQNDVSGVIFKNEKILFQYGYFYATAVVYILILLVFSTTVPAISLTALIYFALKTSIDGLELISYHRKELDSDGKIVTNVIRACCVFGVFFELLMMGYYAISGLGFNILALLGLMALSIAASIKISRIEIAKYRRASVDSPGEDLEQKWKKSYKIPFL